MSRLTPIPREAFSAQQQEVFESITGGKRGANRSPEEFLSADGGMLGPFNAMVHNPALGVVLQRLGEMLRHEGALGDDAREIAILVVAASWRARFEWWAHAPIARRAGVTDAVLDALASGRAPSMESSLLTAVHDYAFELVHDRQVSDSTYQRAASELGEAALVELTILLGYYTTISMILNAFDVPLPHGERVPFDA